MLNPFQAIILPVGITAQTTEEQRKHLMDTADELARILMDADVRAEADLRCLVLAYSISVCLLSFIDYSGKITHLDGNSITGN